MRIGIYGIIFLLVFASVLPMVSGTIAKPDLIVSRIEYYPSKISAGETFTLNATIENVGSAPVIGKFSVALLVMEKKVNETDIIGLSTGEEKNISFTWRPSSGGKFTIKVLADSNKEVIEENEENNEFSIDITVGGEVSLPDLVISEINYLPLSPKVGDYITIDVTIKNIGNALADAPFKVSSNVPRGKIHIINDSLEPNEEIKISDTFPALVSGEFSIKFFVDISYEVIESNETNNEKSITIIIEEEKLPDLIISSATFDPMKPKSGEEVTIKAKIENIGKEKVTTGFVVSFRLEIILIGYINISSLDIGESIEVKQIWIARAGNYNISIIADEKNFVKEMNETNNKYRLGIFVSGEPGPGVPDLVVKSVEYEPKEIKNAKLFIAGGLFVRTVNVLEIDTENISDKEVVYKVNADYEITTNVSNVEISFKGKATIHIKGNRTVDGENITWKGFVYLKFIGIGKIKTPTRTIEVVGVLTVFGTGAFIKKDGNFTLALFGGILFEIGKVVTIKAKIANIGLGNVDKSFIVSFILDGKVIAKEEVEGLAMGGETEVVVYAYADDFTILPYHRLFVLADSSFVITEANEKNNLFVLTIPTVSILRGLWCNVILTPDYASGTVSILVKSNVSLELLFITIALPNGENITINLTTLDQHVWFGKFSITIAGIHNITLTGITKDGEIISQVVHTIQRKVQEIKAKIIAIIEEENITLKLLTKVNVTDVGITISRSAYHRGEINITTKRGMLIRSANIYVQVSVTIDPSNTSSIRIEIKIDVDALTYLNLSKLKLFYYNETSGEWEIIIESGIDLEKGIVWANLTHLSTLGVFESEYSAPIAKIKANDGKIGEKIIADASDSYDPNGLPLKFQFDFGDGTKTDWLDSTKAEHIYTKEGKYNVKVSVSNGYITSDATIEINIASAVNLPPKAVIKKPILKVAYVGEKLEFDASGSSDPEGADLTFSWDFGDGNNATGKIVEHKYTKKGKYIVKLKVSDGVNTNTTSKEIEVKEKPKVCMIAFIVPIALLMLVRVLPGRRKT